jgi:hypothetical protein
MKRMYTERHNKAGRILLDAIYNGARGSDICMADVGSQQRCEDDGAPYVGLNHVCPPRCSPQADQGTEEHAWWLRTKRPDIMLCNTQGHSQEDRARHDICIVELKTCKTRPTDQLTAARLQHEELVERLVQRGYQRDKIKIYHPTRQGTIYAAHTIKHELHVGVQLVEPSVEPARLHTLMVQHLPIPARRRRHHLRHARSRTGRLGAAGMLPSSCRSATHPHGCSSSLCPVTTRRRLELSAPGTPTCCFMVASLVGRLPQSTPRVRVLAEANEADGFPVGSRVRRDGPSRFLNHKETLGHCAVISSICLHHHLDYQDSANSTQTTDPQMSPL